MSEPATTPAFDPERTILPGAGVRCVPALASLAGKPVPWVAATVAMPPTLVMPGPCATATEWAMYNAEYASYLAAAGLYQGPAWEQRMEMLGKALADIAGTPCPACQQREKDQTRAAAQRAWGNAT